jgi:TonB family protein
MKHFIYIFAGLICYLITLTQVGASPLENKKQRFQITVLNTGGEPQQGIILKVAGYSNEYISDEQGLIDFEQSTDNNYVRTANFYFPTDKNRTIKSLRLDEAAQDTIIRIDRPEDLARFKQSGKTLLVNGVLKEGGKPVPHAEISIQGTGKRTFSNAQGEFSIEADYSHLIMIRAERMENKYLDIESFLQNPNQPLEIRMTKKGADRVYHVVEKMPEYPGGMKAFFNYIRRKAHTTELAEETQKEGAVMIQFIVEKDGSITSPSIVRGLDARLDTAALDAIIVMPDWIPAQEHGVNVRCKYSVPVPFKKPKPAPEIKKDSIAVPSVPTDSLAQDTILQVIPMPSADSLVTDTLITDTTLVASADSIAIQKETAASLSTSEATEAKPKKRNFIVRFFRWLFGIKDKENTPAEPKEEKTSEVIPEEGIQKEE